MTETDVFKHSTPELYDRFMGPLLFEPYAELLAERAALLRPSRILETAAGTGIVTRALSESVPEAEIVATDINPGGPRVRGDESWTPIGSPFSLRTRRICRSTKQASTSSSVRSA